MIDTSKCYLPLIIKIAFRRHDSSFFGEKNMTHYWASVLSNFYFFKEQCNYTNNFNVEFKHITELPSFNSFISFFSSECETCFFITYRWRVDCISQISFRNSPKFTACPQPVVQSRKSHPCAQIQLFLRTLCEAYVCSALMNMPIKLPQTTSSDTCIEAIHYQHACNTYL